MASAVLYHPDYTVGPGITPGLLTLLPEGTGARGLTRFRAITAGGEFHPAPRTFAAMKAASKSIGSTIRMYKVGSFTKGAAHAIVFGVAPSRYNGTGRGATGRRGGRQSRVPAGERHGVGLGMHIANGVSCL